jgi:hypothetical protein
MGENAANMARNNGGSEKDINNARKNATVKVRGAGGETDPDAVPNGGKGKPKKGSTRK